MADSANACDRADGAPAPLGGGAERTGMRSYAAAFAWLFASHLVASRLGLLLQPAGDLGSPFWPAAGVAMAGLLIGGVRLWPAIALSGVLEALWSLSSVQPAFAGSTVAIVAAAAGVGKTLEAVVGVLTLRRGGKGFVLPIGDREIARLFVVSGIAGAATNATVGAASLYWTGLVDINRARLVWLTTWAGDVAGIFLFVPLAILWFAAPHAGRARRFATFGMALLGFMIVVSAIAFQIQAAQDLRNRQQFERHAIAVTKSAQDQLNTTFEMLYGLRGLFDASDTVTDDEFRRFAAVFLERRPALQSVGWLPRVAYERREEFERSAATTQRPDYRILEHRPNGKIGPAGVRGEYFPLRFVVSKRKIIEVHGYDVFSVGEWRAAGVQATTRSEPTAALPISLSSRSRVKNGILVLLPQFDDEPSDQQASGNASPSGYVAALLDTDELLRAAIQGSSLRSPAASEAEPARRPRLMAILFAKGEAVGDLGETARVGDPRDAATEPLDYATDFAFGGRTWEIQVRGGPPPLEIAPQGVWWMLLGSTVSAGLIGAFTLVLASRSARVEDLVDERTRELAREVDQRRRAEAAAQASEAWLHLSQDAAGIGVWEWDCTTNEVRASASHWRLFGRADSRQPTTWDAWIAFLHPEDREPARDAHRRALHAGHDYAIEARVVWPDGTIRSLRHEGRIDRDAQGKPLRIAGASWDITADRERAAAIEEQQRRFRALTENSEIGFWQTGPDGRAMYLNAAICRLLELERPEDAMGFDSREFFAPDSRATLLSERAKRERGISSTYEATIVGRRGRQRSVMISAAPILDEAGNLQSTIGSYIDITELKNAEARLMASENELASIYHGVSDAVSLWKVDREGDDAAYRCLRVNRAALATFGVEEVQLVGKLLCEIVPSPIRETLRAFAQQAVDRRETVEAMQTVDVFTGRRTFEVRFTPLFCQKGRCSHLLVAAHDVTARVEAESELRRAVEFRDSIIEHAREGLCISHVIDEPPFVRFSLWNKQVEQITGYTIDEVNRRGWLDLLFPDPAQRIAMETVRDRAHHGETCQDECVQLTRADGRTRNVRFSTTSLSGANGESLVLAFVEDVTEREQTLEALRASEDRYRGLVSAMAEGVLMVDERAIVEACNASLCKILGLRQNQVLGRHVLELFANARDEHGEPFGESNCAIILALATGVSRERRTLQVPQPNGQTRWLTANTRPIFDPLGRPRAAVVTITDVTNLRVAAARLHAQEQQLAHVSRVSTMGEFVAGIAHEINQPLHAITNFANACERTLTEEHAGEAQIANALAWTRHISKSVRQAANVIRRLRDFFHRETAKRESTSLCATVRESLDLTSFLVKEHGVAVDLDLEVGDDRLEIDRVQIQQVLVNLMRNAIEAVANLPREKRRAAVRLVPLRDGIEVVVADSGPGVPPEDVPRLFEPFHTTKPDGMGMGLAISKTIVESHGGTIWYEPQAEGNGPGGAFHFILPKHAAAGNEPRPTGAKEQIAS